jgi:hypothetical protein
VRLSATTYSSVYSAEVHGGTVCVNTPRIINKYSSNMDTTLHALVGCSYRNNSQAHQEGEQGMNKVAHFFLVGFAVALMSLLAALALSNRLDARSSETAEHPVAGSSSDTAPTR